MSTPPPGGLVGEIMDLQKRLRDGLQKRKRNSSAEGEDPEEVGDLADDEGSASSSSSSPPDQALHPNWERTKRIRLGSPPPTVALSRTPYVRSFTFGRMLVKEEAESESEDKDKDAESEGTQLSIDDYIQANDYGSHHEEDENDSREDEKELPSYDPYAHYSREEPFVEDEPEEGEERDEDEDEDKHRHEIGGKDDATQERAVVHLSYHARARARAPHPPRGSRPCKQPIPPPTPAACLCHCQKHPAAASHAHCGYPPPTASERFFPMSAPRRIPVKLRLGFAPETHQRQGSVKERLGRRSVHDRLGWPFN